MKAGKVALFFSRGAASQVASPQGPGAARAGVRRRWGSVIGYCRAPGTRPHFHYRVQVSCGAQRLPGHALVSARILVHPAVRGRAGTSTMGAQGSVTLCLAVEAGVKHTRG